MKKLFIILSTIILAVTTMTAWAQENPKLSYQAVVRDNRNRLLTNSSVNVEINILKPNLDVQYHETFANVPTNQNGLMSLQIGNKPTWDDVVWFNAKINVKITLPDASVVESTSEVSAVPLAINALYADSVNLGAVPQSDWNETNPAKSSFIRNKPDVGSAALCDSVKDCVNVMISDTAKVLRQMIEAGGGDASRLALRVDKFNTHVCDSVKDCVTGWISDSLATFSSTLHTHTNKAILDATTATYTKADSAFFAGRIKNLSDSVKKNITAIADSSKNIREEIADTASTLRGLIANADKDVKALKDSVEHNYVSNTKLNDTLAHYLGTKALDSLITKRGLADTASAIRSAMNTADAALQHNIDTTSQNIRDFVNTTLSAYEIKTCADVMACDGITAMQTAIGANATKISADSVTLAEKIASDSLAIMQNVSDTASTLRALITGASGDVGKLNAKVDSLNQNLFDTLHIKYVTNTVLADTIKDVCDSISALRDSVSKNYVSNADLCEKVKPCVNTQMNGLRDSVNTLYVHTTKAALRDSVAGQIHDSLATFSSTLHTHTNKAILDATTATYTKADSANLKDNYYTKAKINDTLAHYLGTKALDSLITKRGLADTASAIRGAMNTADAALQSNIDSTSQQVRGALVDTAKNLRDAINDINANLCTTVMACADIQKMRDSIQTNNSAIATNATNISTNTTNISTNATNIAANTSKIHSDSLAIMQNVSDTASTLRALITGASGDVGKLNAKVDSLNQNLFDTLHIKYVTNTVLADTIKDVRDSISALRDSVSKNYVSNADLCEKVKPCVNTQMNGLRDSVNTLYVHTTKAALRDSVAGQIHDSLATFSSTLHTHTNKAILDATTATYTKADSANLKDNYYTKAKINDTLSHYTPTSGLATVATSGSYTDLTNQPTIPTTVAELTDASDYAKLAEDNTFSGKNVYTDTILVPSSYKVGDTVCRDNAVNVCDLIAVFDSLTHRVDDLEKLIQRMVDASKPKFDKGALSMLVADGSVTITAPLLAGAGDPELSAEICAFTDSACTNREGCTSAALSGADIVGTFTSLSCGTHYIRAVATNSKGSDTAYFKAFVLVGQIVCDQASSGKIYTCVQSTVRADYHFSSTCAGGDPSDYRYEWTVDGMTQTSTTPDLTVDFILVREYEIACTATHKTNSAYKVKASVKHTVTNSGAVTPSLVVGTDDVHGTAKVVYYDKANVIQWYNAKDSLVLTELTCSDTGSYKVSAVSSTGCKATKNVKVRKVVTYCELAAQPSLSTEFAHQDDATGRWLLDSVADIEGNKYLVVQIGSQCWMRQNMKSKMLPKSGVVMEPITVDGGASSYTEPKCFINLTADKGCADFYEKYGVLYNWAAAMDTSNSSTSSQPTQPRRGICPEGWHVPSDAEFTKLCTSALAAVPGSPTPSPAFSTQTNQYEGTNTRIATVLAGGHDWKYDKSKAGDTGCDYEDEYRDAVHFSALPARNWGNGSFYAVTESANFWTATQSSSTNAWHRNVGYANAGVRRNYNGKAYYARSVRCVRD